uniref:START domain-containing protein n=1 Tax=Globisporangium ultimum (strain ATCC 200006 / CBS 805.95 / DAOM BR144) TaxID=431595 RepID=K3WDM2_GLOUD
MIHLRLRVSELEAELREIRQQKKLRSVLTSPGLQAHSKAECNGQRLRFVIPSSAVPSKLTVASVWKAIAHNQNNERTRSERENVRLKLVLENQLRVASNLQKLLSKSTATRDIEKCIYRSKGVHTACPPAADWMNNHIFEDLLAEISIMYSEIDSMLAAISLAQSEGPRVAAKIFTDEHQDLRIEVLGNKEFPFDIHATGAAEINAEEGTIHENFILDVQLNKSSVRYRMKQILRRYVEKDRVIVIWRGYFDPIELSGTPITGAQFVAKGFIVVKRPTTSSGDASLVQTCYFIKPELSGDLTDSKNPLANAVLDFVLKSTAGNITANHQMIENALLEQMLNKAS